MKADVSRKILNYLVLAGAITIASTSPFFLLRLARQVYKDIDYKARDKQRFDSAFSYLKRRGYIFVEKDGFDVRISPTEKGMAALKKYQIDELRIKEPQKWDGKIRVVAFDIPSAGRVRRDAFRAKLKELGFYSSQKSVWLHPFDCKKQIDILKSFFGLDDKQILFFTADKISDTKLLWKIRKAYKI